VRPARSPSTATYLTRRAPQPSPREGVGAIGTNGTGGAGADRLTPGGRMGQSKAPERRGGALLCPTGGKQLAPRSPHPLQRQLSGGHWMAPAHAQEGADRWRKR
jgi:hypothetical protein